MAEYIFLGGASVRAAAWSAQLAGLTPLCADLFADADLQEFAPARAVSNYPAGLITASQEYHAGPWIYTGALENHPEVVAKISSQRPLWGNSTDVIAKVRDPFWIAEQLDKAQISRLKISRTVPDPAEHHSWLRKPIRSAGGNLIQHANTSSDQSDDYYWQEYRSGLPISAVLFCDEQNCHILGITWQWVGLPALGATEFAYCGSYGPLNLPRSIVSQIQQMGDNLSQASGLAGLTGLDLILHDQTAYLVEINPRYTASMELLELSTGASLLSLQKALFSKNMTNLTTRCGQFAANFFQKHTLSMKAILFAREAFLFPETNLEQLSKISAWIADRPATGTMIQAGQPICTIISQGKSFDSTLGNLKQVLAILYRDDHGLASELTADITPVRELLQDYSSACFQDG